jgi:hypothetical protein
MQEPDYSSGGLTWSILDGLTERITRLETRLEEREDATLQTVASQLGAWHSTPLNEDQQREIEESNALYRREREAGIALTEAQAKLARAQAASILMSLSAQCGQEHSENADD